VKKLASVCTVIDAVSEWTGKIASKLIFGVVLWQGILGFVDSWQLQETVIAAWRVVLWPFKLMVPIAAALLLLQGIAKFTRDLFYAVSGKELS